MSLEPSFARRWDNQLAAYVSASFKTQNLASWAHEGVNLIGKLVNAATLWYGAHLVMGGELSVGQFVAFNMFAQRVAQPIMRMAQLWTDFQQTGISMARLGDILNTRTEVPPSSAAQLPPIKATSPWTASTSATAPKPPPCSVVSAWMCAPAKSSASSGARAPAKAPSPNWCSACTPPNKAASWWTASTSA